MTEFLTEELHNALLVLGYGALLGFAYDILFCLRHVIKHNTVAISVEDMLYWILVSITTLNLLAIINDGGLRMYFLLGMIGGAFVYNRTIHFILKKIYGSITIRIRKRGGNNGKRRKKI